ncbi:MAG TPA: YraN family protein [Methylomirabilota bacterium]|nr:YraN family protein [Methylomirabilota bacterium]
MPNPRHALGERAEAAVAEWLTTRGWTVVARRWRCAAGELDIVAFDGTQTLVAIEVKLRQTGRAGQPLETIGARRLGRLRSALGRFVADAPTPHVSGLRIDLVEVRPDGVGQWRLRHHPGIDAW